MTCVDFQTLAQFIAFGTTALTVSLLVSLIAAPASLVFLVARAPRQTLYALAEEVTGETTNSYAEVSFWLFYGVAFPSYAFASVLLSLPYVWFMVYALDYSLYWLAGFPLLVLGVVATLLGWFARKRGLPWTRTPRLRDRILVNGYAVLATAVIFGVSYYTALQTLSFVFSFF